MYIPYIYTQNRSEVKRALNKDFTQSLAVEQCQYFIGVILTTDRSCKNPFTVEPLFTIFLLMQFNGQHKISLSSEFRDLS